MSIYEVLDLLEICYQEMEHEAVFTVNDFYDISKKITGTLCKNLFLTDQKQYYLVILKSDKKANLKYLEEILLTKHLSFVSEDRLKQILRLERGSVTPFGIIHDESNQVKILIDKDLKGEILLFHPNMNTKTLSISYEDFLRFLDYEKHEYVLF